MAPGPGDDPAQRARRVGGIACIVASALAFGAMAILARVAYADGVDTATLLALRFTLAAACLAVIVRVRSVSLPRGRDLAIAATLGGVGYGGQAASFFTALTLAPAGLVALLLYLHPALVAILAVLFLHERVTAVRVVALLLALAGMTLTVAPVLTGDGVDAFPNLPLGIALGVAAAGIYSVYIVIGTRVGERVEPLALSMVVVASAAVVFVVAAAMKGPVLPHSAAGWTAVVGIALVSTVAAITLFFAGLARIGPTRTSTLSTIEPVFTVMLAAVLLGERIEPIQLVGGAFILGAVVMLARAPSEVSSAATPTPPKRH